MSISPVTAITRAATRKDGEPLNILTAPTHERYEVNLADTGHNFYAFQGKGIKNWTEKYAKCPDNYLLLNPYKGAGQIPLEVDFDLVLSQNKFGQYQVLAKIAQQLGLPLVSLEHTLPMPMWPDGQVEAMSAMRGDINVFISDYSIPHWYFNKDDPSVRVIKHCVDTDTFCPPMGTMERENRILSVVNDWVNRDWCCGYNFWVEATRGLPVFPVGATQGISEPAKDLSELVSFYQGSRIFVNTSTISPVPTALLEAMACGCAIVTTDNCMIPEFVEHDVNGFMTNDQEEMHYYLQMLLHDDKLAKRLGDAARETILKKCSKERFVTQWDSVFQEAANKTVLRSISV